MFSGQGSVVYTQDILLAAENHRTDGGARVSSGDDNTNDSSLAAWGRYSNDKGSLDVANHELGVVLPIRGKDLEGQINRMITWQRPVARYRPDDEPWVSVS